MSSGNQTELSEIYPYHLIEFVNIGRKPKVKNIDVVATKWLEYNNLKKKCTVRYPPPPYTEETWKVYNTMLQLLSDVKEDWVSYTVKIKGRAKSLKEANIKCEKLKETESALTLESEDDDFNEAEIRATKNIKQAQLHAMSDSIKTKISSLPSDSESTQNAFKKIKLTKINQHNLPTFINKKQSEKKEYDSSKNDILNKLNSILIDIKQLRSDSDFIKNEIHQVKLFQQVSTKNESTEYCTTVVQIREKYNCDIPFTTILDFQKFDFQLKDDDSLNKDVNAVLEANVDPSLLISKCIVNMLKRFLSKEVAMQYVAIKKKINKYTMKNTNFFNRIEVIIKRRRELMGLSTCDKEMITALSNVLSNSTSWYKTANKIQCIDSQKENSIPDANGNSMTYQEPETNTFSKILATGTIEDGVFTLDEGISNLTSVKECDASSDVDSDISNFEGDYMQSFSKDF